MEAGGRLSFAISLSLSNLLCFALTPSVKIGEEKCFFLQFYNSLITVTTMHHVSCYQDPALIIVLETAAQRDHKRNHFVQLQAS